jgi:hypothetical protein
LYICISNINTDQISERSEWPQACLLPVSEVKGVETRKGTGLEAGNN